MRLLLDTHAFLWFALDDPKLSSAARSAITDPNNELLISPATYWEIGIKVSLRKYSLAVDLGEFLERQTRAIGLSTLPITVAHAARVAVLPFHHRDPFDRLLAAQCLVEGVAIVSADEVFDAYALPRIW